MLFMRKIFIVLLLLIFSQSQAQKKGLTIYFKDGTTLAGFGKIVADNDIRFRATEEGEGIIYKKELIDKIQIGDGFYQYKPNEESWLRVIIKGKVNLYKKDATYYYAYTSTAIPAGGTVTNYYVEREGENEVFKITSHGEISKNFKKTASAYFKDCPELVEKINNKTYKKTHIEEVIKFYNSNCGK